MTQPEQESDRPDVKAADVGAAGTATVESASAGQDVTELDDGALEQMSGGKPTHPGVVPGAKWIFNPRPEIFTISDLPPSDA